MQIYLHSYLPKTCICNYRLHLFAGSHEAAQQAAVIYSILATCKLHGVEPFAYLTRILSIIPSFPANQHHTLLPGV